MSFFAGVRLYLATAPTARPDRALREPASSSARWIWEAAYEGAIPEKVERR